MQCTCQALTHTQKRPERTLRLTPLASPWAPHKQEVKANVELQTAWQSTQSAQFKTNLQSAEEVFCYYYFFNVRCLRKCHWFTTEKSGTRILVITHDKKSLKKKVWKSHLKMDNCSPKKTTVYCRERGKSDFQSYCIIIF